MAFWPTCLSILGTHPTGTGPQDGQAAKIPPRHQPLTPLSPFAGAASSVAGATPPTAWRHVSIVPIGYSSRSSGFAHRTPL